MKQRITCIMIGVLFFSCVSVVSSSNMSTETVDDMTMRTDFTHTVFGEYAASLGCPSSKYAHAALKNIYAGGWYPFYYISLVSWNRNAEERLDEYSVTGYPKVFFDGGYQVVSGAGSVEELQEEYIESIIECGNRSVPDIDVNLSVEWHGNAQMTIEVTVENNETTPYLGHIRVYVTEISSTMGWKDTGGNPYTFAFLDYARNQDISINPGCIWTRSTLWDGYEHTDGHFSNFGRITHDNVMVFAVVFNDEWHQGYGSPPDGNPFDAYYVDKAVAETPYIDSDPPQTPTVSGPTTGRTGFEYEYIITTTEPEGEDVYYWIDWGDGHVEKWIGPYDSAEEVSVSHIWDEPGEYEIRVKAKDIHDAESDLSDPLSVDITEAVLAIEAINGGFGTVQAVVKNNMAIDLTDVEWTISLTGGILGLRNIEFKGIIDSLPTDKTETILPDKLVFGFGNFNITISVRVADPGVYLTQNANARLIGPFVRIGTDT